MFGYASYQRLPKRQPLPRTARCTQATAALLLRHHCISPARVVKRLASVSTNLIYEYLLLRSANTRIQACFSLPDTAWEMKMTFYRDPMSNLSEALAGLYDPWKCKSLNYNGDCGEDWYLGLVNRRSLHQKLGGHEEPSLPDPEKGPRSHAVSDTNGLNCDGRASQQRIF